MRADIAVGAIFPDYELTDHTGKHRRLSDLQGPDPLILVLSRGGFCPKDRRQAEGLVQLHHEMEVGCSRLVTISTDNMLLTNEYRTGVGAHWTFLSDPGRKVQKDLDIAEYTDSDHNPMIPHVSAGAGSRHIQNLQRLLVFWPADHRRAAPGFTRGAEEMPPGLGHHQARSESCLGTRGT
jgi:peroxiredoxin